MARPFYIDPNLPLSNFDDVGMFHRRFGLTSVSHEGPGRREIDEDLVDFRTGFLDEELQEYKDAIAEGDEAKEFDALLDIVYVAMGNAHLRGFPWQAGWNMVQRANMSKVRAEAPEDSERGGIWDVIKPPGFEPPDIEGLLFHSGFPADPEDGRWSITPEAIVANSISLSKLGDL